MAEITSPNGAAPSTAKKQAAWRIALILVGVVGLVFCFIASTSHFTTTVTEKVPNAAGVLVDSKQTLSTEAFPEALGSALLGASLILIVLGAMYSRITKISGPGGIALEFSNAEKQGATDAVAAKIKDADSKVKQLASSKDEGDPTAATEATADLANRSSTATLETLQSARELLKRAVTDPDGALRFAEQLGVPKDLAKTTVLQGQTSPELWDALAGDAVRRVASV